MTPTSVAQQLREILSFPDPVNETSARLVAAGVVALSLAAIVSQRGWVLVLLAYGFVARVLTGPKLSPLGLFVTRIVTPRLHVTHRYVPGPPKRFAQGIGATLSVAAAIAWFGLDQRFAATILIALITIAATLESVLALCLGCTLFAGLMRVGIIPTSVCERCNDLRRTPASTSSTPT